MSGWLLFFVGAAAFYVANPFLDLFAGRRKRSERDGETPD
jgi:hypothetical protein